MKGEKAVVGVFTYVDDAVKAVRFAKEAGHGLRVYTPTFVPELSDAVDSKRSIIGIFSLIGACSGLVAGFALAIWTSLDWPLRVGAKEIVAIPGFVVVGYEWTILWGALATLFSVIVLCKLPSPFRKVGYDPRFSNDKFGVVIGCNQSQVDKVSQSLTDCQPDEVIVMEGL